MHKQTALYYCLLLLTLLPVVSSCTSSRKVSKPSQEFIVEFDDETSQVGKEIRTSSKNRKKTIRTRSPHQPLSENTIPGTDKSEKEDAENARLQEFIKEWLGVRHRIGGRTKKGVDCSGFVGVLYQEIHNISLPRSSPDIAATVILKNNRDELETGDLVFFCIRGKRVSHVGYYLEKGRFVHSSTSQGVIISSMNEPYWDKYFCGFGKKEDFLKQNR